jgi:hypothetical protein
VRVRVGGLRGSRRLLPREVKARQHPAIPLALQSVERSRMLAAAERWT